MQCSAGAARYTVATFLYAWSLTKRLSRLGDAGGSARHHGVELLAVLLELGERAAVEHAAARQLDLHRIDETVVDQDLEVHVRAGREAGRADEADDLTLAHLRTNVEAAREGGHVAVGGLVAV